MKTILQNTGFMVYELQNSTYMKYCGEQRIHFLESSPIVCSHGHTQCEITWSKIQQCRKRGISQLLQSRHSCAEGTLHIMLVISSHQTCKE